MSNEPFIMKDKLKRLADSFNVSLDEIALDRFDIYAKLLAEWNEKINITAITDPDGITVKHFADSLALFKYAEIQDGAKCIDVGTGAGFPGVAMLIARPDLNLTLLDSTGKKLNVIANILDEIGLSAEILHARAEEASLKAEYRENFDFVMARAVANLRELSEYCLPFVKENGSFISLKGARADEEIIGAKKAISILGGKIASTDSFILEDAGERNIIMIKKIRQTPTKYPRQSAKIAKFPLE
ncbi:MAG: 16S rRNA (guanine(527)-N(7))-methyltransferase RsmG [Faecalibacterium sp.]|nr:16S rRNA (guanine(527)-N(7))-methyltransferase RsmG [Ruminococcus sp.]MCM1392399.1 16S rRNA (guanine(527)-N(7))-methyltransferase RsmG [Ruminococcus sp.]MCM1484876.1 16S rRNA (guanine(527)-N(7))-methyltransferase RsmG [Faecalibacterium sp.]